MKQNQQTKFLWFISTLTAFFLLPPCLVFAQQENVNINRNIRPQTAFNAELNEAALAELQRYQETILAGRKYNRRVLDKELAQTDFYIRDVTEVVNTERAGYVIEEQVIDTEDIEGNIPIDITVAIEESPSRFERINPEFILDIDRVLTPVQKVTVPQLVGRRFDYANISELLEEMNLQIGDTASTVVANREGLIVRQYPEAGTKVNPGTRILIAYGIGAAPDFVIVPDYVGMNIEEVVDRMPNDRLTPGSQSEKFHESPPGTVISHFPEYPMEVDEGTEINFEISSGPQPVEPPVIVPDLFGRRIEEVVDILRENELFLDNVEVKVSLEPENTVIQQRPRAGTEVERGSAINVWIAVNDISMVQVPNVIGLPAGEAISVIKQSGLGYSEKYRSNADVALNEVFEQYPEPGAEVEMGSVVTIVANSDETVFPPWALWGAGVAAAAIAGGFIGRKLKPGRKKKAAGRKDIKPHLKPVWDPGKQTITKNEQNSSRHKIHLKFIPDKGSQLITDNTE